MAQGKSGKSGGSKPQQSASRSVRKPPTIDLKAEKVPDDKVGSATADEGPNEKSGASSSASTRKRSDDDTAGRDQKPASAASAEQSKKAASASSTDRAAEKSRAQQSRAKKSDRRGAPPSGGHLEGRSRSGAGWIAILIAVLIGAGVWLYFEINARTAATNEMRNVVERFAELQHVVNQAGARREALAREVQSSLRRLDEMAEDLESQRVELGALQDALASVHEMAAAARVDVNQLRETLASDAFAGIDEDQVATISQQIASLSLRLEALGDRLETLSDTVPSEPVQPALERMAERIDILETAVRDADAERRAAVLAAREQAAELASGLTALREAVADGAPYADQLDRVRTLLGPVASLDALADHATTGLPTTATLANHLRTIGPEIARAPDRSPVAGWLSGWFPAMGDWVDSVVRIRPSDVVGWEDAVDRMSTLIRNDDLAGAVRVAEAVAGDPPDVLAAWLADARSRLAAEAAITELMAEGLTRISALQARDG